MTMWTLTASARNKQISLLALEQVDDHGDIQERWVEKGTEWAFVRSIPLSSSRAERTIDGKVVAQADVEFQVLLTPDTVWLSPADRIAYAGPEDGTARQYDIASVDELGDREGLSIKALLRDATNG